jgi:hypothetical protein
VNGAEPQPHRRRIGLQNVGRWFDIEAPVLLLAAVGLAGLTIGWMCAIVLGHVLHVPPAPVPDGVLGITVLMHYSKRQELWLYLLSLAACTGSVVAVFLEWRWFAAKLAAYGLQMRAARWIAALTLLATTVLMLVFVPRGAIFVQLFVLPAAIGIVAVLQGGILFALRRTGATAASPATENDAAARASAVISVPESVNAAVFGIAFALLSGLVFGAYLPFVATSFNGANTLAGYWWFWIFATAVGYVALWRLVLARRKLRATDASGVALYAFLPLTVLLVMPLLWRSQPPRAILFAAAIFGCIVLAIMAARRSGELRPPVLWLAPSACALIAAGLFAASVLLQNPTLLPGAYVNPFDGENYNRWMSDGMFGRAPFRDFIFPYGPLLYYWELVFVNAFGLDRYHTPFAAAMLLLGMLCSSYVMWFVLRGRFTVLLAAPALLVMYGGAVQLRLWLGCVAFVSVLWALERRSRSALVVAGALAMIPPLHSPEVGIAALIVESACVFWYSFGPRDGSSHGVSDLVFYARWLGLGAALVVVPATAIGLATNTIVPYVLQTAQFLGITDACCAAPYPPLFTGSHLAIPAGSGLWWLLQSETFRIFYAPPIVLTISIAYLAIRALARRRIEADDVMLGAFTLFGVIIFRTALGRSEIGHAQFAMLPTMIVAWYLAERAVFAAAASLRRWIAAVRGGGATAGIAWALQGTALCAFAFLLLGTIFRVQQSVSLWIPGTLRNARHYYAVQFSAPKEFPVRDGWTPIRSADGKLFFFRDPHDADMPPTLAFLKANMAPSDALCGIPFLSRYQFMVHRPSGVPLGCDTWGLGETPQWRRRLIEELATAKPRYLIYNEADWPNPDGIPWLDRMPDVAAYYLDHYRIVKRFGDTLIFERGTPGQAPSKIEAGSLDVVPLLRTGWFYPETNQLGSFRWTAPSATALVRQLPGENTFTFEVQVVAPQIVGAAPQTLTVTIDGKVIASTRMDPVAQPVRSFRFPVAPVRAPTTVTVGFTTDKAFPASADPRFLGIPIVRFGFVRGSERLVPAASSAQPLASAQPEAPAQPAAAAKPAASVQPTTAAQPAAAASPTHARAGAPLPPIVARADVPRENVPPGLDRYSGELQGLFPAPQPGCCWISERDRFMLDVPRTAKTITLTVIVPGNVYANGEEGITAIFVGTSPQAHHGLASGEQGVVFNVPRSARGHKSELDLELDKTFVPAEKHINEDQTRYGILLRSVEFK